MTTTIPPNHVVCTQPGYEANEYHLLCAKCYGAGYILNPLISEWRTSTSPARLIEMLGDKADERRLLAWGEWCESEYYANGGINKDDGRWWVNHAEMYFDPRLRANRVKREAASAAIRCLFPNPHIARERVECPGCGGKMGGYIPARSGRTQEWIRCNGCKGLGTIESPIIDPRWLSSTVIDMAKVIRGEFKYWARIANSPPRPELMPVLADALLDAGCDSEEVIEHCQSGGPHVAECWVISEILKGGVV